MKSFIDFIVDAKDNKELMAAFNSQLKSGSPENLSTWFTEKGYSVSPDDCKKLISMKEEVQDILGKGPIIQY